MVSESDKNLDDDFIPPVTVSDLEKAAFTQGSMAERSAELIKAEREYIRRWRVNRGDTKKEDHENIIDQKVKRKVVVIPRVVAVTTRFGTFAMLRRFGDRVFCNLRFGMPSLIAVMRFFRSRLTMMHIT